MRVMLRRFFRDQAGAVTVDWVVLTAGMIALAIGVATVLVGSTRPEAENLGNFLSEQEIETSF